MLGQSRRASAPACLGGPPRGVCGPRRPTERPAEARPPAAAGVHSAHGHPSRCNPERRERRGAYGPVGAHPGSTSTGASTSAGCSRKTTGQRDRARRGPSAAVRPRPVRAPGPTGSSSSRCSRAITVWWRSTSRGSGTRRCPQERSRSRAMRGCWMSCSDARRRRRGGGRELDGRFIAAELSIAFPRGSSVWCSSPRPDFDPRDPEGDRVLPALAPRWSEGSGDVCGWVAARSDTVARHARLCDAAIAWRWRTRPACRDRWCPSRSAAPGSRASWRRWARRSTTTSRALARDRVPHADRLGRGGPPDQRGDAEVFQRLIPGSRKVIFDDTGHMAMLERPAAFNVLLRDFLPSSARRAGALPLVAPSEAPPTSLAYFRIATSTCSSARAPGTWPARRRLSARR